MKKYFAARTDEDFAVYVGTAREIKRLRRNLLEKCGYFSAHGEPKFNWTRLYGLEVRYYDAFNERYFEVPEVTVMNSSTVLEALIDGEIKEVTR